MEDIDDICLDIGGAIKELYLEDLVKDLQKENERLKAQIDEVISYINDNLKYFKGTDLFYKPRFEKVKQILDSKGELK